MGIGNVTMRVNPYIRLVHLHMHRRYVLNFTAFKRKKPTYNSGLWVPIRVHKKKIIQYEYFVYTVRNKQIDNNQRDK